VVGSGVSFVHARGVNGGMSCAVCTVVTGVAMQVAEVHEEDLFNATKRICNFLPSRIKNPCFRILTQLEPYLSNVSEKLTPDLFCMVYGTCTIDKNEDMCHLFPVALDKSEIDNFSKQENRRELPKIDFCKLPFVKDICKILNNSFISLTPLEDYDGDGFSAMETGRYSFRLV
jgi:hypothetical protein